MPRKKTIPPPYIIPYSDNLLECLRAVRKQFSDRHPDAPLSNKGGRKAKLSEEAIDAAFLKFWHGYPERQNKRRLSWKELLHDFKDALFKEHGRRYKLSTVRKHLERSIRQLPYEEVKRRLLDDRQLRDVTMIAQGEVITSDGTRYDSGWAFMYLDDPSRKKSS